MTRARPLSVLLVSEDRTTLRRLSRFLSAFRYDVRQVAHSQHAVAAVEQGEIDFVIVNAARTFEESLHLCRLLRELENAHERFALLAARDVNGDELLQALDAGADDFLAKPLLFCEVLARLRSGARLLELGRRICEHSGHDAEARLPGKLALHDSLEHVLHARDETASEVACVALEIDFLLRVGRQYGRPAVGAIRRDVSSLLRGIAGVAGVFALDERRLAAVLVSEDVKILAGRAEEIRRAVRDREWTLGENSLRLTTSLGLAVCRLGEDNPGPIVERAIATLGIAQASGGDFVAIDDEYVGEEDNWRRMAEPGVFFEDAAARDVATPCFATLQTTDSVLDASKIFRSTAAESLPVVNVSGGLVGVLRRGVLQQGIIDMDELRAPVAVSEYMDVNGAIFDEDAPMADVLEFAMRSSHPAVVVSHGRPTGMITADNLAALVQPLTGDSFARSGQPATGTADLLIAD